MCGIVGIVAKDAKGFSFAQQDLFKEMLITDAIRGEDSTGVFSVNKSGNSHYLKLASHPHNLLRTNEYRTWSQDAYTTGRIMVGHNRKATTGAVVNKNAHPFAFGPIILVHNGYIDNFRSLVHHRERDKQGVEVDSHAVALLLARNKPEDVIPELKGAFTLVWYNTKDRLLHFVRNTERPLAFADAGDGMYFASEKGMLRWLLRRRTNNVEIAELKPGVLLTIDAENKSSIKEVKVYEKLPVYSSPSTTHHRPIVPLPPAPAPQNAATIYRIPTDISKIPPEDAWNIHYGQDAFIDPKNVKFPQIIFKPEDFKKVSEEHVEPPVWKIWGPALDSNNIDCFCQFRGSEEDVFELAYKDHLIFNITRVADKTNANKDRAQVVYGTLPRPVEMTVTPNALPITVDHLAYIMKNKCLCDAVDCETIEPTEQHFVRDGFDTEFMCKWCIEGSPECKKLCKVPGKCEYCEWCKSNKDEKAKGTAVQDGK